MWALTRLKTKSNYKYSSTQAQNVQEQQDEQQKNHSNIHMVVPYTKGLSKSFKKICGTIGIQVHFKGVTPSEAS